MSRTISALPGSLRFAENGFSEKTAWHPCVESFGKGTASHESRT